MSDDKKDTGEPIQNLADLLTGKPLDFAATSVEPLGENPKIKAVAKEPEIPPVKPLVQPLSEGVTAVSEDDLLAPPPVAPIIDNPVELNADGTPRKKMGRPRGQRNRTADFSDIAALHETHVDYGLMSGSLFDMGTGTLATIFGPEWQAKTPQEREMVVGALRVYLESKQVKDIPPGLMLTIILVAYSAPRLQAPPTREKLRFGWTWVKMKIVPFFRRKHKAVAITGP
jgi:hypothetical protein